MKRAPSVSSALLALALAAAGCASDPPVPPGDAATGDGAAADLGADVAAPPDVADDGPAPPPDAPPADVAPDAGDAAAVGDAADDGAPLDAADAAGDVATEDLPAADVPPPDASPPDAPPPDASAVPDAPPGACVPSRCDPAMGDPYPAGDARCVGAPDGRRCDDGALANGVETCRAGRCLREHAHCRCEPPGGAYPDPDPDPARFPLPTAPADPPWRGAPPTEPSFADAWGHRRVDLSRAWERTRGSASVRVAVVDTGCDVAAGDLAGQVEAQRDVVNGDDVADDEHGHGTALASLVAGRADGRGVVGVAPDVRLVCVRVTDRLGRATYDHLAAGIVEAVARDARVILVGVGGSGDAAALRAAVDMAHARDVLVVAPAGSAGGGNVDLFPAAFDGVVSVTASDRFDQVDEGADVSPRTALAAPGVRVVAAAPGGEVAARDGSSVAAAYAAGAAALVRSAAPGLTRAEVRALLRTTGAPLAPAGFERWFDARRLDVGRAVAAAAVGRVDVAVASVDPGPSPALPGEAVAVRVRVENRGTASVARVPVTVRPTAGVVVGDGGATSPTAALTTGALAPGASEEFVVRVRPPEGASARIEASVAAPGDADAGNDRASAELRQGARVVHWLRLGRSEVLPPAAGAADLQVAVTVENAGNVPEPATELRVVAQPEMREQVLAVPALGPGERAPLPTARVALASAGGAQRRVVLYLRPALGQGDLFEALATFNYTRPRADLAQIAYFQLPGSNLIADAPWRSVAGAVPVLFFFARMNWVNPSCATSPGPSSVQVMSVSLRNPPAPASGTGPVVYEDDWRAAAPSTPAGAAERAALDVRDEDDARVATAEVLTTHSPPDGAHRVVWIPTAQLPNRASAGMIDPGMTGAFLHAQFDYLTRRGAAATRGRERKMLAVALSGSPLPTLSSTARPDQYFDAHFHSIAEWYTGDDWTGPAKAYGGPLEMVIATARAVGFLPDATEAAARGRLVTTDHNTFFDDAEAPCAGPTQVARWGGAGSTGSAEMDVYRARLGETVGEEVTLGGSWIGGSGRLGRHALVYGAGHVRGDWGELRSGGCLPAFDQLLAGMAGGAGAGCGGQSLTGVGGFTFAAHPFASGFVWSDGVLRQALSLPDTRLLTSANNNRTFYRPPASGAAAGEFVFRGYQFWNARTASSVGSGALTFTLRDINPFPGAASDVPLASYLQWSPSCGYRAEVEEGVDTFLGHVRDGLRMSFMEDAAPRDRFIRKAYFVAGSDAHGDFNYGLDLVSTVVNGLVGDAYTASIFDSAWGRPRTYVFGGTLEDMRRGRAVVTDGPVLELEVDAEGRLDWDAGRGPLAWNENVTPAWFREDESRFDGDGLIGGGGALDGERTALVPYRTDGTAAAHAASQEVWVRTRCVNNGDFGGEVPTTLRLHVSGRATTSDDPAVITLTPHACNGRWLAQRVEFASPITDSVALLAHAEFGGACPGAYDAWTNPVWLGVARAFAPVRLVESTDGSSFFLQLDVATIPITVNLPVSMKRERVYARLWQVGADGSLVALTGGTDGRGGLLLSPAAQFGWNDSADMQWRNLQLRLSIPPLIAGRAEGPVRGARTPGVAAGDERFVLTVERGDGMGGDRRLRDAFDNPLGVFAFRFTPYATCRTRACAADFRFCGSQCQCVMARRCVGGFSLGSCACCLSINPLNPLVCGFCGTPTDVFSTTCPNG